MAVFAEVVNGAVTNLAVAETISDLGGDGTWVNVDNLDPRPSTSWSYNGASFSPTETPPPTLDEARMIQSALAQSHYDIGLIAAGFTSGGVRYALDPNSIVKAIGAASAANATLTPNSGITWPSGFTYGAADGSRHAMSASEMLTLGNNLFHYVAGCDQQLAAILTEIAIAANVGALQAIDVTAGYPEAK